MREQEVSDLTHSDNPVEGEIDVGLVQNETSGADLVDRHSVIARVAKIFDSFIEASRPLGLTAISKSAGLPKTTTHRLLAELTRTGLVERNGHQYSLGLRLFELGNQVGARSSRNQVLPYLEELYGATKGTIHFAVRSQRSVVYVEKLHGHDGVTNGSRVAGRLPLHATATGKAILAFSGTDIDEYLALPMERLTPHTVIVPELLSQQLAETRERGWAVERDECVMGWASVATPVFGFGPAPVGAISVTLPTSQLNVRRLAALLTETTKSISIALLRGPR